MKLALFSDIHGNLEAFDKVFRFIKDQSPDLCFFLGDAVGYGADPEAVLDLLKDLNPFSIAGNHDWAVLNKTGLENFNSLAREAVLWTRKKLSCKYISQLSGFPLVLDRPDFIAVHGSPDNPESFNYIFAAEDARRGFARMDKDLCFIGHTHFPGIFARDKSRISYIRDNHFSFKKNYQYIVNVGSVGQPRDRDNRACVCIYNTSKRIVTFHRLRYNVKKTADKIINAGLPEFLAERLYLGC